MSALKTASRLSSDLLAVRNDCLLDVYLALCIQVPANNERMQPKARNIQTSQPHNRPYSCRPITVVDLPRLQNIVLENKESDQISLLTNCILMTCVSL